MKLVFVIIETTLREEPVLLPESQQSAYQIEYAL